MLTPCNSAATIKQQRKTVNIGISRKRKVCFVANGASLKSMCVQLYPITPTHVVRQVIKYLKLDQLMHLDQDKVHIFSVSRLILKVFKEDVSTDKVVFTQSWLLEVCFTA